MNLYEIFNNKDRELIEKVENIENRDYSNEEINKIKNKIVEEIMSKSYKNGDMDKARIQYNNILNKI